MVCKTTWLELPLGSYGFDSALKGFKLRAIPSVYIAVSITQHNEGILTWFSNSLQNLPQDSMVRLKEQWQQSQNILSVESTQAIYVYIKNKILLANIEKQ